MLKPRINECTDCDTIDSVLSRIDDTLSSYGHDSINNDRYELDIPVPKWKIDKLIKYKEILLRRRFNSNYLWKIPNSDIISRVITLLNQ